MHLSLDAKVQVAAKGIYTMAARDFGGKEVKVSSFESIAKEHGCHADTVRNLAKRVMRGESLERTKGQGRKSSLPPNFKDQLDSLLVECQGDASYEIVSFGEIPPYFLFVSCHFDRIFYSKPGCLKCLITFEFKT